MWNSQYSHLALGSHGWGEPSVCSWFWFPANESGTLGWKIPLCDEAQLCFWCSAHSHFPPPLSNWTWWEKKRKGAVEDLGLVMVLTQLGCNPCQSERFCRLNPNQCFFSCVLSYSLKPIGSKNFDWTPKKGCTMRELPAMFQFQLPKEVWGGSGRPPPAENAASVLPHR